MAAHLFRFEAADQLAERDLALQFVAVVAGHQQDPRPRAVPPVLPMPAIGIGIQP